MDVQDVGDAADAKSELRRVDAILDADLAELDAPALLDQLLERIQQVLAVDTVAVLLHDPESHMLVAHAARGLEEEVRQGVRVPVGRGFAGRIAAERTPVILDDVGPNSVVNPILYRRGIKSMLGVPLVAAGSLVGVMHVGSLTDRQFTADDSRLLQMAGDRLTTALSAQQAFADRTAARTLQRSLLPPRLPNYPGIEFATRFVPADEFGVGGDWYDAFVLPSGHIGIVMGDIAGRGLRAAVVMGRMRSVLRGYAFESSSPADALDRLDRKFSHFEPGEMATVLYAMIDPSFERVTMCSAGHLPPVMAEPEGAAVFLDVRPCPPIGAYVDTPRWDTVVEFPVGATMAAYTDGLVERRNEPIDDGLERLRAAFHSGPVDMVCSRVMADLIGSKRINDDIALMAFRRTGP